MRNYLVWFFEEFDYGRESTEVLLAGFDQVVSCQESAALFEEALAIYEENCNCDYKTILAKCQSMAEACGVHQYTVKLLVYICMSRRLRQLYEERGLDLGIWFDSMCDLKYKNIECKLVKGIYGSFVAEWFGRFFNLTRFALGRLQFEIVPFKRHYQKDGKVLTPESPVLNVHIPRTGTPLDRESCKQAYDKAEKFYRNEFGDRPIAFVCNSWLLFEKHREMLKPTANIIGFMNDFDIIEHSLRKEGDYESVWRLFDCEFTGDVDLLPGDSSLRREYKALIKRGEPLGSGYGVFFA